jgi:predicted DsbA family dithiol-disulfide isomerase
MQNAVSKHRGTPAPRRRVRQGLAMGVLLLAAGAAACGQRGDDGRAAGILAGGQEPEVLATIEGESVTLADLREYAGDDLDQLEVQYRRARSKLIQAGLDQLLRQRVIEAEARNQNRTVAQLITDQAGGSLEPTEAEIAAWHQSNPDRVADRPLEEVRPQIVQFLREQKTRDATVALEQRLQSERGVTVHFEPFRARHDNEGSPALGPANAPVTLVEYSDFECPFCARFATTLKQLHQEFGDDLRIVYRQFPITSIHPGAFKAAEASLCAHDQGRFWEMHDAMFAQQNRLAVSDLRQLARQLGLDQRKFDSCLDTGRHVERVQNDTREAVTLGVNGTPALFVNGVPLEPGAQPFEVVANAIRQELARARR